MRRLIDMKKPDISENFTIEDIHKIREYNAERRKKMPRRKRLEDIEKQANECEKDIEGYREKKAII